MRPLLLLYLVGLAGFLTTVLIIVVSNLRSLRRLGSYPLPSEFPSVAVLLPIRNEVACVERCVRSLLSQEYSAYQILVLNDGSTDGTDQVLARLEMEDRRLHVLQGQTLAPGWLGKHWACHQLAEAAWGADLLLFTDADTCHHPLAVRDAVAALMAEHADLLTALPQQEVCSWAERLIVPIFQWGFFTFLPIALAHRSDSPALAVAVGQFMLFRRSAYDGVGGHQAVRQQVAEDVWLARRVKAHGLRWRLVDGSERVRCRMYRGRAEVLEGFTKNLFAVFDHRVLPFIFVWLWTGMAYWVPVGVWLGCLAQRTAFVSLVLATVSISESLLAWGIFYWRFHFPLYLTLLYPLTVLSYVLIAIRSGLATLTGGAQWKGRALTKQKIRWL